MRRRWTVLAIFVLAILIGTYMVTRGPSPLEAPPMDPTRGQMERELEAARQLIAAGKYGEAVRKHLSRVLERDSNNAEALALKRQAEEGLKDRVVQERPPRLEVDTKR
jgi:hypothetical protein